MFAWGALASGNYLVSGVYNTEMTHPDWQAWTALAGCWF